MIDHFRQLSVTLTADDFVFAWDRRSKGGQKSLKLEPKKTSSTDGI